VYLKTQDMTLYLPPDVRAAGTVIPTKELFKLCQDGENMPRAQ